MTAETGLPPGWRIEFEDSPSAETRALLAREINAFHSRTVQFAAERFTIILRDLDGHIGAGLSGVMSWGWLFIEAVWVSDGLKGCGVGRAMMQRAEARAAENGCHSVWLDTFQARDFYLSLGYEVFAALEAYPGDQNRYFMKKRLAAGPA